MSRVGKKTIQIPEGVQAEVNQGKLKVKGPKGELFFELHPDVELLVEKGEISVKPKKKSKQARSLWGLTRAVAANLVKGVVSGYEKKLELEGVGYRARVEDKDLVLEVGYSHPVKITAPEGITFSVEKNVITVSGIDKELVGGISARIRRVRPPEPYKGKGIKYQGEKIRRKLGKRAAGATQ